MPEPLKKLPVPTKTKRPADPNKAAQSQLAEHMRRTEAANQPVIDPASVISEHMRKLGAKGGKVSGAKRMENLSDKQRREIARLGGLAKAKKRPVQS